MPQTVANQTIANAVQIERYKAGHIKAIMPLLNKLSADIETLILRMDTTNPRDVTNKLKQINTKIDSVFNRIQTTCNREYKELIKHAIKQEEQPLSTFQKQNKEEEKVSFNQEEINSSLSAILASLVLGKSFNKHLTDLKNATKSKVASQVRTGIADNENISTIARRVRGTKTRRFKDGIFNATLGDMDAVIRTTIQSYVNKAKQFAWKKFSVNRYIWLSVLDGRTTAICRGRSNKIYVVGTGPLPPAHFRCRSTVAPYKKGMTIPQSYSEWLKTQSRSKIEDILGKQKAKMFLSGKLPLDKFTVPSGRELTIKELQQQ